MLFQDCFIIHFHPNKSYHAHKVVAGLLVFLCGLWNGILDVHKFDNFFMTITMERVQDAWWDINEKCVVTIVDAKLDTLLKADKDLMFTEKAVEVDISQVNKEATPVKKVSSGILSTGSISTFKTTGTTSSKAMNKVHKKVQITTNQPSALTMSSFSKADMFKLLEKMFQAYQIQQASSLNGNTGGQKTGQEK